MPRRLLGILILLLVSVAIGRAQGDVVLMRVGEDTIKWSECEARFRLSQERSMGDFIQNYTRLRQKILYAKELGLDTTASFRQRREYYRRIIQSRFLKQEQHDDELWIKLFHVTYPLDQQTDRVNAQAQEYLDSLCVEGKDGSKWQEHSKELPWIQVRHLLKEWQDELSKLNSYELSKPFYSPMGAHVIMWTEQRRKNEIDVDVCSRLQEVEDGLLLVALEDYFRNSIVCTKDDLESYFEKHRADYGWGVPHFRGAVVHCQSKKEAKAIKKYLKKYPEILWEKVSGQVSVDILKGCKIESGLFAIGKNPYIDKLAFNCGEFEPLKDYPYTWVQGKKLKSGPEDFRDVLERMKEDCWQEIKKRKIKDLDRKYKVEINEEVLKTVNLAVNK